MRNVFDDEQGNSKDICFHSFPVRPRLEDALEIGRGLANGPTAPVDRLRVRQPPTRRRRLMAPAVPWAPGSASDLLQQLIELLQNAQSASPSSSYDATGRSSSSSAQGASRVALLIDCKS